ncbi:MAG: hypothetical protein R3F43_00240 [bacterium]
MTRGGASGWNTEAGPLWIDTVPDSGLAMLAGLAPSGAFGAVDALANNGFDRHTTGLPTTDIERMRRFLLGEYARRGLTEDDAARVPPFGGPWSSRRSTSPPPAPTAWGSAPTAPWCGPAARPAMCTCSTPTPRTPACRPTSTCPRARAG